MVDMDKIKAQNKTLVNVANDLMDIISNQNGFTLRQNNRDHYMGIALPCGCDQENSPFPTLQLIPGTPEYIPIPGKWHDPNKCSKLASAPVIIANGSNNMVPTAQAPTAMSIPAFTLPDGTVPEGNVSYPLYFNYAPPPGAEYNAMDQFPMDPSASMGGGMMENNGFSYPLMNWLAEDDQNQFQPGVQQGGSNHGQ
ncbi:hypothetical protein NPX13_g8689 [Xylaria arbuscula]|uniref:Uncharacterized protein n=1 Tax=Xylaria arbuscula TaxID=114810 RepID=A0A9W8TJ79_9PEZI|nr:hypothetical protein NPX13_g8689 [Xylaria arbuscula]